MSRRSAISESCTRSAAARPDLRLGISLLIALILAPVIASSAEAPATADPQTARRFNDLVTAIVLDNIPHTFEDRRDWGMTSERWDGLKISLDGWRIKTKRRKKIVNHGTWKMYRVRLADPDDSLSIKVNNVRDNGDGILRFDVVAEARLVTFGRVSQWVKGVQLFSISADGNARVQLRTQCELATILDITTIPPDVVFFPEVKSAQLTLLEFKVVRVSDVGGEVAQQIGRGIRSVLKDKIGDYQEKLVVKMNKQIAKNQQSLRLSLPEVLKPEWSSLAKHLKSNSAAAKSNQSDGEVPSEMP